MTEEECVKELLRVAGAIAKTKSPKLTTDYGKHMTRLTKELAAHRRSVRAKSGQR